MDTFECIRTRRTTRTFVPQEIPETTMHKILEAGRLTPSARNRQPWHFIAIRDQALLQRLAPLCSTGQFLAQARFAVAIVTDPANRWHEIDGARAVQNMELAGWNDGVGTCWIGGLERDKIKELLAIPPHLHLLTILPFGYPTEPDAPRRRTKKRPEEVVHWDRFGQQWRSQRPPQQDRKHILTRHGHITGGDSVSTEGTRVGSARRRS